MKQSYEQVLQWFLEQQAGTLSPEEQAKVDNLLSNDPAFRGIWNAIAAEAAALDTKTFADELDPEEELAALKQRMQFRSGKKSYSRLRYISRAMVAAAVLVFMAISAWFTFYRQNTITKEEAASLIQKKQESVQLALANGQSIEIGKPGDQQEIKLQHAILDASAESLKYQSEDTGQNTLNVPAGKTYKLVLSDGTEVWLNAATSLRFPFRFKAASREVFVNGEAFFKVATNARQPFIVHTPLTSVQVLGTSFNVNTYQQQTVRTSLVDGAVITSNKNGQEQSLKPGEEATLSNGNKFDVHPFDADEVTGWIGGLYYFYNMPVTDVARIASRIYGVNFILDKQKFAGKSITGVMDRNKLTAFLDDLETIAQSTYHISGKDLFLK